ncbi:MAG: hypothetical protein AAGI17_09055 [Planctomycetota bacterium]
MIPTRILGKILLGKATPFQIALGAILAATLGFIPGPGQAPLLFVFLLLCLLVFNANLFFAGIVGTLSKLVSLVLIGAQFEVGKLLIDGPLEPLFRLLINAPVLAWFGFDNYVTVGGLILGPLFGGVVGFGIIKTLQSFRKKMADLDEGSEKYQKYANMPTVKLCCFVFLGGKKGKKSWEELATNRIGNPIRIPGVIVAVLLLGVLIAAQFLLKDAAATGLLRDQLGRANGATVDLERAEVDLFGGQAKVVSLAAADPGELSRNTFEANTIDVNFSTGDLLKRRFTINEILVADALSGGERATPGELIGDAAKPKPAPETDESSGTIEDYIKKAEEWKKRLAQLRDMIDRFRSARGEDPEAGPDTPEKKETLKERLAREAREKGYANVYATHLVEKTPKLTIEKVTIDGVRMQGRDGVSYDIDGAWLSTNPDLVGQTLSLQLVSSDDSTSGSFMLPPDIAQPPSLTFKLNGLDADQAASLLAGFTEPPFKGGTLDLALDAKLDGSTIQSPLNVTLKNSTVMLPGAGPTQVDALVIPLKLSGPLDNPAITLEPSDLSDALIAAGKRQAANRLTAELDKAVGDAIGDVGGDAAKSIKEQAGGLIGNLIGGGKKKDPPL